VHVFDYSDVQPLVESFCKQIPELLAEHSVTADLVGRVVNLGEQATTPFTVAVVGQMRVGKSSLINALLDKDLAQTGVTETTATINWIRYGDDASVVRVHWKDKPPELISRNDLQQWTGNSSKAANTRFLELFDDAEFLKVASIVDTPGLRSVINAHENSINEFLGMKCDADSRQLGSQADAIIYVLMPVARESDDAFLSSSRDQTQLTGASSFNSLAVLHKWETIESNDQVATGKSKAHKIAGALGDSVCCVIPVSAPLARAAQSLNVHHWDTILQLVKAPAGVIEELLLSDEFFADEMLDCPVSVTQRKSLLLTGLPWPSLKLIVTIANREKPTNRDDLQALVLSISQIDFLRSELDRRFFARSRTLKLLSTVTKAWEPCRIAEIRLRNKRKDIGDLLVSSERLLKLLDDRIQTGDDDLAEVRRYINTTQESLRREHMSLTQVLSQISSEASRLKTIYDNFVGDLSGIEWLGNNESRDLPKAFRLALGRLFGHDGVSAAERAPENLDGESSVMEAIERNLEMANRFRSKSKGGAKQSLSHAIERLEQLADHYEQTQQEIAQ
jgi:hypothetical protein